MWFRLTFRERKSPSAAVPLPAEPATTITSVTPLLPAAFLASPAAGRSPVSIDLVFRMSAGRTPRGAKNASHRPPPTLRRQPAGLACALELVCCVSEVVLTLFRRRRLPAMFLHMSMPLGSPSTRRARCPRSVRVSLCRGYEKLGRECNISQVRSRRGS